MKLVGKVFESKAWYIEVSEEKEVFLVNKRFESEGRLNQYVEVTQETIETAEIQGVKIPKYIRKELVSIFSQMEEFVQAEEITVESAYEAAPYEAKLSIDGELEAEEKDLNEVDMAFLIKNVEWTIEKLDMDIAEKEDKMLVALMELERKFCQNWLNKYELVPLKEQNKVDLFKRYHELLMASLQRSVVLTKEERIEMADLQEELNLKDRSRLYQLHKAAFGKETAQ